MICLARFVLIRLAFIFRICNYFNWAGPPMYNFGRAGLYCALCVPLLCSICAYDSGYLWTFF